MIKHLTFSALTGGALVLAYATWSKWRGASQLRSSPPPRSLPQPVLERPVPERPVLERDANPERQAELDAGGQIRSETGLEADALDLPFDEIWASAEVTANPNEQLVDFSSEQAHEEEEGPVAPEDLGARWLARATDAMSPFRHVSVRDEADAALNVEATRRPQLEEQLDELPDSSALIDSAR